jgi:hypothetical protein
LAIRDALEGTESHELGDAIVPKAKVRNFLRNSMIKPRRGRSEP